MCFRFQSQTINSPQIFADIGLDDKWAKCTVWNVLLLWDWARHTAFKSSDQSYSAVFLMINIWTLQQIISFILPHWNTSSSPIKSLMRWKHNSRHPQTWSQQVAAGRNYFQKTMIVLHPDCYRFWCRSDLKSDKHQLAATILSCSREGRDQMITVRKCHNTKVKSISVIENRVLMPYVHPHLIYLWKYHFKFKHFISKTMPMVSVSRRSIDQEINMSDSAPCSTVCLSNLQIEANWF